MSSSDFCHAQWCLSDWSYHFFKILRLDRPPHRQSLLFLQSRKNCSRQCASPESGIKSLSWLLKALGQGYALTEAGLPGTSEKSFLPCPRRKCPENWRDIALHWNLGHLRPDDFRLNSGSIWETLCWGISREEFLQEFACYHNRSNPDVENRSKKMITGGEAEGQKEWSPALSSYQVVQTASILHSPPPKQN